VTDFTFNNLCRIFLIAGRPDQVHNCTITNISMTSLSIRCSEGFNGGLAQQFMLEVKDSGTSELRANYSSPVARFTVNSLIPNTIYLASVYAFNSKGRSDPTVVQAVMPRVSEKQPTGEKGEMEKQSRG
jgi:immunoglobulin superfamily member 9B